MPMRSDVTEAQVMEEDQRLALVQQQSLLPDKPATQEMMKTAQQMRVIEVSEALMPAYQKASTLELTDAEIAEIMAPFPDSTVEIRPHDGLIYIPHIHISDRLNHVFKPGKWALVCRRHWLEGTTMYGEYVLLIRGCYVGESIGGHPYQPNNPKTNYSDTLESTAAEALRRICGKRLSCGSQVWNPEYAKGWCDKYAARGADGKWFKRKEGKVVPIPTTATKTPTKAAPADATETPEQKKERWAKLCVQAGGGNESYAKEVFVEMGWIMDNETLMDISETYLPKTKKDAEKVLDEIRKRAGIGEPPDDIGKIGEDDYNSPTAAWRAFPVPFGKHSGIKLGELDKKILFGFWANFKAEHEYQGKPRKVEQIERDQEFRDALDQAGLHYEFTKPEDQDVPS